MGTKERVKLLQDCLFVLQSIDVQRAAMNQQEVEYSPLTKSVSAALLEELETIQE